MKHVMGFAALAASCLAIAAPAAAQTATRYAGPQDEEARFDAAQRRFDAEYEAFQNAIERYRQFRASRADYGPPPRPGYDDERDEGDYDASRYYRPGPQRVLGAEDRVYRGQDGRYYCRRNDGTTGLIVGGAAGGLFGNAISNRHSRTVGTLLGAIAGAAIGSSVDRNNQQVTCQ
ncbi:glycine zipper 2TM domain-containing protein [Sphingomonas sp. dw_22]|uniref:glycine zipper 2TM domain-containing protein n=1 Tax=Sphingomonas sp. dw_22 TaxID=2721175 RepID=UPI001BD33137|nr:glycine zipper 2TM domain-containing protein [Sphingomonas sp. dw_22]